MSLFYVPKPRYHFQGRHSGGLLELRPPGVLYRAPKNKYIRASSSLLPSKCGCRSRDSILRPSGQQSSIIYRLLQGGKLCQLATIVFQQHEVIFKLATKKEGTPSAQDSNCISLSLIFKILAPKCCSTLPCIAVHAIFTICLLYVTR